MGRKTASGELPFDIPRTTAAIERSRVDVPGDTVQPLFVAGQPSAPVARRAGRRSYPQGKESKLAILETALDVIERKGYSATSLRDIAAEVGMTQAPRRISSSRSSANVTSSTDAISPSIPGTSR